MVVLKGYLDGTVEGMEEGSGIEMIGSPVMNVANEAFNKSDVSTIEVE